MPDVSPRPVDDYPRAAGHGQARQLDPRRQRSRAAALHAAGDLLVAGGLSAITFEAVSERSGVAKTTIYRHWPTRADLVKDAFWRVGLPPGEPPSEGNLATRLVGPLTRVNELLVRSSILASLFEAVRRDPSLEPFRVEFVSAQFTEVRAVLEDALSATGSTLPSHCEDLLCLAIGSLIVRAQLLGKPMTQIEIGRVAHQIEELASSQIGPHS